MKKYIRTKDGIFEGYKTVIKKFAEDKVILAQAEVIMDGIIKTADTIEELCDEFVYEYQTGVRVINKKIVAMPDIVKTYGAIWTKNGLIYVAKMNKEGELELI